MERLLLTPPVAFLVFLALSAGITAFSGVISAKGRDAEGKTNSYACGEDMQENQSQPEYSQFFKFAFFFTIMHVAVLIIATDPGQVSPVSLLYLGVSVLALMMLFRRQKNDG